MVIDFQGPKITSDVGLLLLRQIDDRFKIIDPRQNCLEDLRSLRHTKHSLGCIALKSATYSGIIPDSKNSISRFSGRGTPPSGSQTRCPVPRLSPWKGLALTPFRGRRRLRPCRLTPPRAG